MEEVWKDMTNISSLQNPNKSSYDAMNLQDFLARPFLNQNFNLSPIFPATSAAASEVLVHENSISSSSVTNTITSTQGGGGGNARKRIMTPHEIDAQRDHMSLGSDRRYKRLIKNRESAARSRDRKEAYTSQLKVQIEDLKAEIAMLKKKEEELCTEAAAQVPKRPTLSRTTSSPI